VVDETAKISVTIDASGAKTGAADVAAAGAKVIATEDAVATAVEKSEAKKSAARSKGSKAAKDAADADIESSNRTLRSLKSMQTALDQYARQWDPLVGAMEKAKRQYDVVFDISQRAKGDVQIQALKMLEEATDRMFVASRNLAAGFDVVARKAQLDPIFDKAGTSAKLMAQEIQNLNDAVKVGTNITDGYANAHAKIVLKYDEGAQAALKQREAIMALREAQNVQTGQAIQSDPRTILGLGQTKSAQGSASVFEETAQAQAALTAETQRLMAVHRPAAFAAQQYAEGLQEIQAATHLLDLTDAEAAASLQRLNASLTPAATNLRRHGDSAFAARFATQQLGVQTIQFFSSLEAGQPFLMAFIGQAHQVADVAIATGTGFKVLADGVKSLFSAIGGWIGRNPLTTALIAGTAAMAALGVMAETTARRLEGVKNVLSGVRGDFVAATQASEALAKSLAAATTLTTAQSRDAATKLFQGGFTGTTQEGTKIVQMFADLSKVVGETAPNFDRLAESMKDPAKVMQAILDANPKLAGFDQALANQAKRYMELGESAKAAAILMQAIATATKNVYDNMTPLEKAMLGLEKAINGAWIAGKSFGATMGEWVTGPIAGLITGITNLIEWIKKIGEAFDNIKLPDWMQKVLNIVGPAVKTAVNPIGTLISAIPAPGAAAAAATAAQQQLLAAPGAVPTQGTAEGGFGIMQLLPGTAAGLGVNPFIPNENVQGGMKYIAQLQTQMANFSRGLEEGIARAYNVGPHGDVLGVKDPKATNYANKVAVANIANLPTDTASMIDYWGQVYKLPPNLIALGKRIAMVESGGHQGPTSTTQPFVAPGGATVNLTPGATPSTGPLPVLPQIEALRKAISDAEAYDQSLKKVTDTTAKLHATENALKEAIAAKSALAAQGDTEAGKAAERYKYDLIAVQGELYRNLTPQQEMLKALRDQAAAAQVLTEGDRALFEQRQQLNEINKQHPETANVATDAAIMSEKLASLSGEYKKMAFEAQIQIDAQNNLNQAFKEGYAAVVQATAANEAYVASLKFPAGPMRDAARQGLTGLGVGRAVAGQEGLVEQQKLQNKDTLEYIKAESDSLAQNSYERTINLAGLKAEQEAKQKLSNLSPAVQAAYVKEAKAVAEANLIYTRETQAIQTVAGTFSSAFDTISNSITDALVKGQGAAVNWKNVMLAVAQQIISAFLKLAVINPMINALFPGAGYQSTLGDAFNALNKVTPGSSSTEAGGGGSGGIFGTLFSLALKAGSLFSGGVGSGGNWQYDPLKFGDVADVAGTTTGGQTLQDLGFFKPLTQHTGGIVGANDNHPARLVHSAMFANAPRFHSGSSGDLTNVLTRATDIMARRAGMQGLQPGEMPAVLMRNERVLTEQQDNALRMMIGGMTDQLAAFKGTGTDGHRFTPSLPRFHGGSGGGEFSSIMARGQQALSSAPVAAAPGGTDNVSINIDARGSTAESVNTFRRSMPQIATTMSEQLARARARNG